MFMCIAVTKEVPEQRCEQVISKKCETHYDLVKEQTYKVECNVKLGKGFHYILSNILRVARDVIE